MYVSLFCCGFPSLLKEALEVKVANDAEIDHEIEHLMARIRDARQASTRKDTWDHQSWSILPSRSKLVN